MKRVLMTRPLESSQAMAQHLREKGADVHIEPLFKVKQKALDLKSLLPFETVIMTSHHALAALEVLPRETQVWATGHSSYEGAKDLGFKSVTLGGETVPEMLPRLDASFPRGSRFLYLSGALISHDIKNLLSQKGHEVQRAIVYETTKIGSFSQETVEWLQKSPPPHIPVFSSESARLLCQLLKKHHLEQTLRTACFICFSFGISEVLNNSGCFCVKTCLKPTMKSFWEFANSMIFSILGSEQWE